MIWYLFIYLFRWTKTKMEQLSWTNFCTWWLTGQMGNINFRNKNTRHCGRDGIVYVLILFPLAGWRPMRRLRMSSKCSTKMPMGGQIDHKFTVVAMFNIIRNCVIPSSGSPWSSFYRNRLHSDVQKLWQVHFWSRAQGSNGWAWWTPFPGRGSLVRKYILTLGRFSKCWKMGNWSLKCWKFLRLTKWCDGQIGTGTGWWAIKSGLYEVAKLFILNLMK